MKIGVLIEGQEGLTWERWRRIAATVDNLGFDSLWRSDHFLSLADAGRDALETWVTLSLAAAETRRVRFGPLVCPITFRHPALVARMAAALDVLSGGRLVLGLGAGWNDLEHRAFGIPFPPLRERIERLEEGIQVIRLLMGDEPAAFDGRYYQVEAVSPQPRPVQRPRVPILVGAKSERMLRVVARYADQWDMAAGPSPRLYRARRTQLADACREIGRDPDTIYRSVSTAYLVGRDERELLARVVALQALDPSLAGIDPALVPEVLRALGWRVGTPEQLLADLQALAAEGVQRVILQHNDLDDLDALELLAREVLPAFAD